MCLYCVKKDRICSPCYQWTLENTERARDTFSPEVWDALLRYGSPEAIQLIGGEITKEKFEEIVHRSYSNTVLTARESIKQSDKLEIIKGAQVTAKRLGLSDTLAATSKKKSKKEKKQTEQEIERMLVEESNRNAIICGCGDLNSCVEKLRLEDKIPMMYKCKTASDRLVLGASASGCNQLLTAQCQHYKSEYCWNCRLALSKDKESSVLVTDPEVSKEG
jgi:integrase